MVLCSRPEIILKYTCKRLPYCIQPSSKDFLDIDFINFYVEELKFFVYGASTICQALKAVDLGNDKFE